MRPRNGMRVEFERLPSGSGEWYPATVIDAGMYRRLAPRVRVRPDAHPDLPDGFEPIVVWPDEIRIPK